MKLTKMIPYMDSEDLYDLAQEIIDGTLTEISLSELITYMDEEDVAKLAVDAIKRGYKADFTAMAPFMDDEDVYNMAKEALRYGVEFKLRNLLPYMDEEDVDKICQDLIDHPDNNAGVSLKNLYPYASQKGVDKIFMHYAKQGCFDADGLPYVSDSCLHQFVKEYCERDDMDVDIDVLYPYLSSQDLKLILKIYLKKRKGTRPQ